MSNKGNKKGEKQVSLAGVAKSSAPAAKPQKKKGFPWAALIAVVLVLALLVGGGIALFGDEEGPTLSARDMVEYTVTPDAISGKVSYFALGVTGAASTDRMDMVAVLCLDREKGAATVMQLPVATYIDKNNGFATDTLGDVWGNPQPEVFCSTCRVRLADADIEEGVHKTCGSATELRTGSASGDLIRVFNDQYGLPIDNYLVIPRAGLAEMIDLLGGMDFQLEKKVTLAGKSYEKGVQTLSGAAAVYYVTQYDYDGTPKADLRRLARQRELFAGLLQRLGASTLDDLYRIEAGSAKGVFGKLMLSEDPVRFNTTSFGKARLLNISEKDANDMKLSMAIARFAHYMGSLSPEKVTFCVLPGESVKNGTSAVYSVNRAQTLELLKTYMNPHGLTLDDTTVTAPQLKENPATVEPTTVTLDTVGVSQSGMITTTTVAKATTTTLAGGATQP